MDGAAALVVELELEPVQSVATGPTPNPLPGPVLTLETVDTYQPTPWCRYRSECLTAVLAAPSLDCRSCRVTEQISIDALRVEVDGLVALGNVIGFHLATGRKMTGSREIRSRKPRSRDAVAVVSSDDSAPPAPGVDLDAQGAAPP